MSQAVLTFAFYRNGALVRRETVSASLLKIGKDERSHLRLDDDDVARTQAVIEVVAPNEVTVIDLGSHPGTRVNGDRVSKCGLQCGDEIQVGGTRLVLEAIAPASVTAPTPAPAAHPSAPAQSAPTRAGAVPKPPSPPPRTANPFVSTGGEPIGDGATTTSPFSGVAGPFNPFAAGAAMSEAEARRESMRVPEDAAPGTYTYTLVKSGPDVEPTEVELNGVRSVEVMIAWGTNVLHVDHLTPPRDYYVGEESGKGMHCDFFLPAEKLGTTRLPLIKSDGDQVSLLLPQGATGTVEMPGQPSQPIERLRATASPSPEVTGGHLISLPAGSRARVHVDQFVFQIATVNAGKPVPIGLGAGRDYTVASYFGLSLLTHASIIGALAFFVPPLGLTDDEDVDQQRLYTLMAYLRADSEVERDQSEAEAAPGENPDDREGGTGERSQGDEGAMGKQTAKQKDGRYGVKGDPQNRETYLGRQEALREAREFGMIGLLNVISGSPDTPTAPWGREKPLGADEANAIGHMWGNSIGEAAGMGGLGLSGIGEGGGGRGEGIGLGEFGGLGNGFGTGTGQGFGPGGGGLSRGHLAREHKTRVPRPRIGIPTVSGRLPPEVIQRIVRQNYGRFRFCYEQGLASNPNLEGRVSVRFAIGRDGAVSFAANAGSDMPNSGVVSCVVQSYYGLSFPSPEGGIVTVVYPIMFTPG
jgi:hypothetical protein